MEHIFRVFDFNVFGKDAGRRNRGQTELGALLKGEQLPILKNQSAPVILEPPNWPAAPKTGLAK